MNSTKNIIIGKVGKTVRLKTMDISTGDDAPMILYSTMSRMNPEYNFYFVGPNQLKKLSEKEYDYLFPNHNVFSVNEVNWDLDEPYSPTVEYFKKNNIKIDFALLFCGMVSGVNVANFIRKGWSKDGEPVKILNAYKNYAGPYIYVLNELGCPYFGISEDARYITVNAMDLANRERLIFTQTNSEFEPVEHIKSKDDWSKTTEKIKAIYSGVERIFLMALDKNWRENIDIDRKLSSKGNKFIVISNGCGTKVINRTAGNKLSRLPEYEKWILNNFKNTEYDTTKIYGVWDEKAYKKWPGRIEDVRLCELVDEVADAKYSIAYSQIPGFVTVKAWELITLGLIPFIHPDYDKDHLLNLPDYVYLKDPEDLKNKIAELDANPEMYKKLLNDCMDMIKTEYLDGSDLNNFIFSKIGENLGYEYEKKEGVPSILNHFKKDVFDYKLLEEPKVSKRNVTQIN